MTVMYGRCLLGRRAIENQHMTIERDKPLMGSAVGAFVVCALDGAD